MDQQAQTLERPRTVQGNKIRKLPPSIRPLQQIIYVNGNGIDPPNDWLDDPLVAQTLSPGPYTTETAEEYLDTEPVELYNGWLVREEMTDFTAKKFEGRLQAHMAGAACLLKFGSILPDQMECHLNNGYVIKPDLSLISWARQKQRVKLLGPNNRPTLMGSPVFLVEVRSPSNRRVQEKTKRKHYFNNGAKIIWDVDEKKQIIYVYRANAQDKPQTYTMDQEIDCEPLLPGWRRQVSDLFEDEASVEVVFSEVHDDGKKLGRQEGEKIGEQRGKQLGREEGEKIGEERGKQLGKQDMLIRLLQARFLDLPETILDAIKQTEDLAQLDTWFNQALMAQSLNELVFDET